MSKPYNGGKWTEARMRSFIMSAIRRAKWPPKYEALKDAFLERGINPKTGREAKLHKCAQTGVIAPQSHFQVDHVESVVPEEWGDSTRFLGYNWNELLPRLFCEKDNLQAVTKEWHKQKHQIEKEKRNNDRTIQRRRKSLP